jgi:hypothetical protein
MVKRKKIFYSMRENLTASSVNAVVRLIKSSSHGADDKLIKQFT